jgi:hypothetical protein
MGGHSGRGTGRGGKPIGVADDGGWCSERQCEGSAEHKRASAARGLPADLHVYEGMGGETVAAAIGLSRLPAEPGQFPD